MQVSNQQLMSPFPPVLSLIASSCLMLNSSGLRNRSGSLASSLSMLSSDLLLGLLVAVHDHAVDQAARFAIGVGFVFLRLLGFLVEVLCCFLVGFVVFVEVGYIRV